MNTKTNNLILAGLFVAQTLILLVAGTLPFLTMGMVGKTIVKVITFLVVFTAASYLIAGNSISKSIVTGFATLICFFVVDSLGNTVCAMLVRDYIVMGIVQDALILIQAVLAMILIIRFGERLISIKTSAKIIMAIIFVVSMVFSVIFSGAMGYQSSLFDSNGIFSLAAITGVDPIVNMLVNVQTIAYGATMVVFVLGEE